MRKSKFYIITTWHNQSTEVPVLPLGKTNRHLLLMICESISLWRKSNSPSLSTSAEAKQWGLSYRRRVTINRGKYSKKEREQRGLGKRITNENSSLYNFLLSALSHWSSITCFLSWLHSLNRYKPSAGGRGKWPFKPLLLLHLQMIKLFSGSA